MKLIKMKEEYGCWKKGTYPIDNKRARWFERAGRCIVLKDLGVHFGRSKYSYVRNGKSEAFGE